ncbi:receptor-type tyrosine-protein phosphatase H-like [Hemitrygon akajei]|uniref:receptor-type tyrosine-protein phosphatase H-like n=1 Tax=Hemitrygon akajei TaxID=2704970 RepID=UPI003BF962BB
MNPFNRQQLLLLTLILTWEVICGQSSSDPSPIIGLYAVNRTTNSLTIEWTKPNDTGADNYTYRITVINVINSHEWSNNTETNETIFTVTGLNPGDQYNLSVQSVNPEGNWSSAEDLINTTNPSPVTKFNAVKRTTNSLTIEWIQPNDTRADNYTYRITVTNVINSSSSIHNTRKGQTNFIATGLDPGDQYMLSVESVTPEDTLSTPEELTNTTNPSPVSGLSMVNRTTNSLTIEWTKPYDTRASDYSYRITVSNVMNNSSQIKNTKINETMFIVTGLDPGGQYNLSVQSVTPEDTVSSPEEVTSTTIPDTISNFRCAGSRGYTIRVEWNEPKGTFTSFKAIAYNGDRLLINRTIGKDENALTVANLQPGCKYTIKITTVSGQTYSKQEIKECWTSSEPIIIGATVGSLLGLILIGVLLFFIIYRVRFRRKKPESEFLAEIALSSAYKPIPVSEYKSYVQRNKISGFSEEYQSLERVGTDQSKKASKLASNAVKNRYMNIFPYDATRVKLRRQPGSSSSDYINASYMPGYNREKAFIATQGPLPNTVVDFWRMIWEQKSEVIVMLTKCAEQNQNKCEQYWPKDDKTETYGDVTVNVISVNLCSAWTTRKFNIEKAGSSESRRVTQFHFTSWPNQSVPKTTENLLQFHGMTRNHLNRSQGGIPVVHCSSGSGRTGTFIALVYLLQQVEKEEVVDVHGVVSKIRMNRSCMVQSEALYIFLHQCILDTIERKWNTDHTYQNDTGHVYESIRDSNEYQAVI